MLYIIGLGLGDEKDITLRGLEAIKICDKVYIEAYTSLLSFGIASDGLSKLVQLQYLSLFRLSSFIKSFLWFSFFVALNYSRKNYMANQ